MEYYPSITKGQTSESFEFQVSRGQVPGHSTVNIYGFNSAVGTDQTVLWENATAYAFPASAVAMTVSSAAGATDAGVKVKVSGLDSGYNLLEETVTLNASGTATTTGLFLRINAMAVTQGNATGIVTAVNGGTTYAQITVGFGKSQMSIYTVPAGYTLYISRIDAYTSLNGSSSAYAVYRNKATTSAGVVTISQNAPFTNTYHAQRVMPRPFTEKTDIELQAKSSTGTAFTAIAAEAYLVKNDISL